MTDQLRHVGSGTYVIHGMDKRQVTVMTRALEAERRRRSARRTVAPSQIEPVTISERSHPSLFAFLGVGRAQFTLVAPRPADIDEAEADAAHMDPVALTAKHGFLTLSNTYSRHARRG